MSFVTQSPDPRSRSPLSGSRGPEPDQAPSSQSGQGRLALVWSRETAVPSRASEAITRFTVAAAARVAGYAGGDALQLLLAVLSWLAMEFLHGCAAYARAMYPPIEAYDHERELAKSEAAKPVTLAVQPAREPGIAVTKPRLTIAVSNRPSTTMPRSGAR